MTYIFTGFFAAIFMVSGLAIIFGFALISFGMLSGYQPDFGELSVYEVVVVSISLLITGLAMLGVGAPFFICIYLERYLLNHCKSKGIGIETLYFKHPYSCRELHDYTSNVSDAWVATDAGKSLNKLVIILKRISNSSFFTLLILFMLAMVAAVFYVQLVKS
ncbi:hypothetical protein HG263_00650 [Pseudoalteromonas sp. JBTF-M23]|uniref:Uncharacterized protein n=1 Tax=Pseudoalteromonas caenipelagi TaxID=2726988 RepID=A0A849V6D5_9GAMM|nr:hypothetical protein [Pseudoalteromonas caenipelagi]NOU49059.1 hypothetical protein [Pseudoalteromonas caenipelagi]